MRSRICPCAVPSAKSLDGKSGNAVLDADCDEGDLIAKDDLPIDRGWAWVIVVAVFFIYGMHGASSKVEGMVLVEMVEHFASNQQVTLWVFSLGGLIMLCSGPISAMIIARTNHRTAFFVGIGNIALGIALTAFMPRMEASFFSWSVIYGFGRGVIIVTSVTSTTPYFRKYTGLAIGISTAGSGLISLVLPLALRFLFDNLTYEGALLMYAGIVSQLLVLAALVRPITYYERRLRLRRGRSQNSNRDVALTMRDGVEAKLVATKVREGGDSDSEADVIAATATGKRDSTIDPWLKATDTTDDAFFQRVYCDVSGAVPAAADEVEDDVEFRRRSAEAASSSATETLERAPPVPRGALGLLCSGPFLVMAAALMFYANAITIVYTSMAAYARSVSVDKETVAALLAASGGVEVLSRMVHGWLSDRRLVPSLVHLALCQAATGVAAALCPAIGGAVGVGVLSVACGTVGTAVYTIGPIALRELLGAENLTMVLGMQLASRGASYVLSTLVIGLLVNATGSWDFVFYYISGNAIAGASLTLAMYAWKSCRGGLAAKEPIS